jgi:hypothetical protein
VHRTFVSYNNHVDNYNTSYHTFLIDSFYLSLFTKNIQMSHHLKAFDAYCPKCKLNRPDCVATHCQGRLPECTCSKSGSQAGKCAPECALKCRHHNIGHRLRGQMQNIIDGISKTTADGSQNRTEEHNQGCRQLEEKRTRDKEEREARRKVHALERERVRKQRDGTEVVKDLETPD